MLHWALVIATALAALSLIDALGMPGVHRPAGYAAVAVLLWRVAWRRSMQPAAIVRVLCIAALAFSGWLYTTDAYWGSDVVESAHRALAWALLALVVWHLATLGFARMRRRKRGLQ